MKDKPKIAAIVTEYRVPAHADVIVGKFIKGFTTDDGLVDPSVDIVSLYLDQIPENDIGVQVSQEYGIPIYSSIAGALCLGGDKLAVDGVLSIGEHGEYAHNEKEQHMYPRRFFFEQIAGVMATSGRSVPVFNDKHLSHNWRDAKWMYDRARELEIPFMAGSSAPLMWRNPWLEHELDAPIEEALVFSFSGLEGYGYHGFEALQAMVERREGGETGLAAVQHLAGDAVWKAGDDGLWSRELAAAAAEAGGLDGEAMQELCENPHVFLLEYNDGLRATLLQLNGFSGQWIYAARVGGEVTATALVPNRAEPHAHFGYLGLNIQEMFLTGEPQYPVERTLLVTGGLDAIMTSQHEGDVRLETPHLDIAYRASKKRAIQPTGPEPVGASLVPFDRI